MTEPRRVLTALRHWPDHHWQNFWCDALDFTGNWLWQPLFNRIYDHWANVVQRWPDGVTETCGILAHHNNGNGDAPCVCGKVPAGA